MEPSETIVGAPARRRFQFGLRTLMLLVTVAAVWFPLVMKTVEGVNAAREKARHCAVINKGRNFSGGVPNGQYLKWKPTGPVLQPSPTNDPASAIDAPSDKPGG